MTFFAVAVLPILAAAATIPSTNNGVSQRLVNDHCPVMTDEFTSPQHEIEFHGVSVRFCCDECKDRFREHPAQFVSHVPQLPPDVVQKIIAESGQSKRIDIDRWTRPVLFTLAGLITFWLFLRFLRRRGARLASHITD